MTYPLPAGPLTPYVTPAVLTQAPTGIAWSTIPPGQQVSAAQRLAEQANICMRASAMADAFCNQVLRATVNTETLSAPNFRTTVRRSTGELRAVVDSWPVLDVLQVQVSASASYPRQWITLPAGMALPEWFPQNVYGTHAPSAASQGGQSIMIAPGYVGWANGRWGYQVRITYVSGWPHAGITVNAAKGATTLTVDDVTGWVSTDQPSGYGGCTAVIADAAYQEVVQVTAAVQSSGLFAAGPGTLTLAAPLQFAHTQGTAVTTLPASATWGVILYAASQALTRGSTSTTVHSVPGGGGGSGRRPDDLAAEAELWLSPLKRTL